MSQNPPASGGWIDPYGTAQPGVPPPGYWQASDGRWYPPESRPAEPFTPPGEMTVAVGTDPSGQPYGVPPAGSPGFAPPSAPGFGPGPGGPGSPGFGPPPGPQGFGPGPGPGYGQPGYPSGPGFGPPGGVAPQPSPYGPGQFSGGPGPVPPRPAAKSRTGLWLILGVVALAVIGLGAFGLFALRQNDDDALDVTTTTASANGGTAVTTAEPTDTTAEDDDFGSLFGTTEDGLADVVGCTRIDDERLQVELVNNTSSQADYSLSIVLEDTPGQRLSDTLAFVEDLRPGERTIEDVFVFDSVGATCAVTAADRYPVEVGPEALADAGACEVGEADSFGDVSATISVTNPDAVNNDYSVTVAIVGSDGVRRGTGYASVDTVRPGETAPSDVFTSIDFAPGFSCEVVAVDRFPS